MSFREDFSDAASRYNKLFMLWICTTLLLIGAQFVAAVSFVAAIALFGVGAVLLGVSGISCAYAVARDTV